MTYVVGLTGGIGSGKSTVADLVAAQGVAVVDADEIARELTAPGGAALPALQAEFAELGAAVIGPDGALDRASMRALAFANPAHKARLEAILHPLIRAECDARCAAAGDAPYVLLVVPLLVESGAYADRIDRLLLVDCPEEQQILRVMARSGLARDEVLRIMAAQASRAQRLAAADDVLENVGTPADLGVPVARLHARYAEWAEKKERASR